MIEGCTNRLCVVGLPKEKTKTEEKKVIDITIGVFFDGTGNNKYNFQYARDNGIAISAKDSKGDKSSYVGSFTNVSQMWFLYNHNKPYTANVYIEGPGTGSPIEIRNNKKAVLSKKHAQHIMESIAYNLYRTPGIIVSNSIR